MAQGENNRHEELETLNERLTEEKIAEVDAKYPSPRLRAGRVLAILEGEDLTRWDYLCFSLEFLGQFAISNFADDRILYESVKFLNKWLYNLHYFHADDIYAFESSDSTDQEQGPEAGEGSNQQPE